MVLVTHDPAVAALADRVIHLSDGQIEREEVLRPRHSIAECEMRNGEWDEKPVTPRSALRTPH
jgi:ABC-type glutathione transport system ATPase component